MPVGLAIPVLRGIFNLPSAIQQEGIGGISTAFFNPERVESTRHAQGAMEDNLPEEQEIDRIIGQAKSPEDLEPAFGLFQKLQHEASASGLINDERAYNQVLGPVQRRLADAARRHVLGTSGGALDKQAVGLMGYANRLNDPNLQAEAEFAGKQYGRNATAQSAQAMAEYRSGLPPQPDRRPLVQAQTDWWANRPTEPAQKPPNVAQPAARVRGQVAKANAAAQGLAQYQAGDRNSPPVPQTLPGQAEMDELNYTRQQQGLNPSLILPDTGNSRPGMPQWTEQFVPDPNAYEVGRTLLSAGGQSQAMPVPSGPPVARPTPGMSPAPYGGPPPMPTPRTGAMPAMPTLQDAVPTSAQPQLTPQGQPADHRAAAVESVVPQDRLVQGLAALAQRGDPEATAILQLMQQGVGYAQAKARVRGNVASR